MKNISKKSAPWFQTLIAIIIMAGLVFPPTSLAFAQVEVPPADTPAETSSESGVVEMPVEQTVEAPEITTEAIEMPVEATVEPPVASLSENEDAEEIIITETVAEVVEILAETGTVLLDENGDEIPLTSGEAVEVLAGADPFFWDNVNKIYVGYTSVGGNCPYFVNVCNQVDKPLTEALANPNLGNGGNLYIEGGYYNEDVVISKELNLLGGTLWVSWANDVVTYLGSNVGVRKITLDADMGTVKNVFSDTIYVTEADGESNSYRGRMLNDALKMINEGGTISLAGATYTSSSDFEIEKDDITLQGVGDATRINGDDNGNGIDIQMYASGVTVRNLRVISSRTGILVNGDNATIDHVTVSGLTTGVELGFHSDNTTLTNMVLTGNQVGLLAKSGSRGAVITNSNIFGNTLYGVKNESNNILDARGNWWGSSSGPRNCYLDKNNNVQCSSGSGDKVYINQTFNWTERKCLPWPLNKVCWDESNTNPLNVLTSGYLTSMGCNDGLANTVDIRNDDGSCSFEPISCDDENAGTIDTLNPDGTCSHTPVTCKDWQTLNEDGQCVDLPCKKPGMSRNDEGSCVWNVECKDWQTRDKETGACENNACEFTNQTRDDEGDCVFNDTCAEWQFRDDDGICENYGCEFETQARDSETGECEYTDLCPAGTLRNDDTGECDTIPTGGGGGGDGDGGGGPLAILGAGGIGGGAGLIPVTGGLMVGLSCTDANTLMLPTGDKVVFSAPMCKFMAGLSEENPDALPAPLPDGLIYASGMTLTVQKDATAFEILPDPVTDTISFVVPKELVGKTFVILFWDAAANGGLGAWVEIPVKIMKDGAVVSAPLAEGDGRKVYSGVEITALLTGDTTLNFTGTFVLAYK
jgi:hypothetical protein